MAQSSLTKRTVLLHVHVRKCGGSTFHQNVLRTNLGGDFYRDASLIDDRYSCDQVSQILDNCPWLRAYSSHKISLDLPYNRPHTEICAIALVRDPIRRFVSHYSYLRHHAKEWDADARELEVDAYIRHAVDKGWIQHQLQHSQLEQLSNRRGHKALEWIRTQAAKQPILLCPMDRFDDLCLIIERRYPELIANAAYPKPANSSPRVRIAGSSAEMLGDEIDDAEFELVNMVESSFAAEFESTFPNQKTADQLRAQFRNRCRSQRKRMSRTPILDWRNRWQRWRAGLI